jgi:hypothetical protein
MFLYMRLQLTLFEKLIEPTNLQTVFLLMLNGIIRKAGTYNKQTKIKLTQKRHEWKVCGPCFFKTKYIIDDVNIWMVFSLTQFYLYNKINFPKSFSVSIKDYEGEMFN